RPPLHLGTWCHNWRTSARPGTRLRPERALAHPHRTREVLAMASTKEWFETVAEAQRRAKKRLPRSVYMALVAGSERGVTMNDNVRAFDELGFRPHIADLPAERNQATTVMGQELSMPVLISPTGVQAVHPEGEV